MRATDGDGQERPSLSAVPTGTEEVSEADRQFMRRALELAARGVGKTDPNPAVGCVIVKDGHVSPPGTLRPVR